MAIRAAILAPTIPAGLNLVIAAAVAGANLMLLVGIPLLLAAGHAAAAWLVLPAVLTIVPHWALVHEAVHAHLHPRRRLNDQLGQVLAVLFLAPFDGLRFGHLSHHALNARPAERAEIFDRRVRSRARAVIVYYVRLLCGVYLVEVASGPLSLLPRRLLRPMVRQMFYEGEPDALKMAERAERVLLGPEVLRRIRTDAVAILLLLAVSGWLYGAAWPLLGTALLGRALLISLLDNAPHYEGPLGQPDQGYDTYLPGRLGALLLHTNLHGTHHRHPDLPWTALPDRFRADGARFAGSYLLTALRQLRGPVPLPARPQPQRA